MEYVRDAVIEILNKGSEDELIVSELNAIIETEGIQACQMILHVLTHLDMDPEKAQESWDIIVEHRRFMSDRMGRSVDIRTAVCDHFSTISGQLKSPKMVEIHLFERTLKTSRYDTLTGLFNRLAFDDEIARELSRAKRYDTDLSLLFFDLDNFKKVNDTHGHQAGDLVLNRVAQTMLNGKRTEDTAVRYGGEELVMILPKTQKYDALLVADRIRKEIEDMNIEYEGVNIPITISAGLASYPMDALDAYTLVKKADEALYRAKDEGKNRVALFTTNKRRYVRLDVAVPLMLKFVGYDKIPVEDVKSKNFSLSGILFEYPAPIELGAKIELRIALHDEDPPSVVVGTVVRVEALSSERFDIGVSISIQEMDYATRESLFSWYESLSKSE